MDPIDTEMTPMLWRTGTVFPYIAGSALGDTNIELLTAIIQACTMLNNLSQKVAILLLTMYTILPESVQKSGKTFDRVLNIM